MNTFSATCKLLATHNWKTLVHSGRGYIRLVEAGISYVTLVDAEVARPGAISDDDANAVK